MDYTCRYTVDERPNLYYPIIHPITGEEIFPKRTRVWAMSREVHEKNVAENRLWWGAKGLNTVPAFKSFLSEIQQGMMPVTLLKHEVVGHTDEAAKELRLLLPDLKFTPKPSRLIIHLLQIATNKNTIILDSFAGSGTTAHAVLKLNAQDGGNRLFILIEMEDYADCITAERVCRVMTGYGEGNKQTAGLGGGFSYYTIGSAIFNPDDTLNETIGTETIRDYVSYSEGISPEQRTDQNNTYTPYLLGLNNDTAWIFYYEPDSLTCLDLDFLATLKFNPLNLRFNRLIYMLVFDEV